MPTVSAMHELTPGCFHLPVLPRNWVNVYYADGVLFDAGLPGSAPTILKALEEKPLDLHVLTHGHSDHAGASAAVCAARNVPLWCPEADADAVESGDLRPLVPQGTWLTKLAPPKAPPVPVARRLRGGDTVGEFVALATPGHSPGHLAYWRERDGVLVLGDVFFGMHILTSAPGLREPPRLFTPDPARNRASARTLLGLRPAVVCFGHGPPLRDPDRFEAFIASLPVDRLLSTVYNA